MELSHLRYFACVAETGSFSRGARRACISAPAMTKAIQKLESELGAQLFQRTTRQVVLTEEGKVLFHRTREILKQVQNITCDLDDLRDDVAGELRVGAMEVFSVRALPVAISALVAKYPRVVPLTFEMHPDSIARHLAEGLLDVGFSIGAVSTSHVDVQRVGVSPGRIVCGRSHPLYAAGQVARADLTHHTFAVPRFFQREHLPSLDQFPEQRYPRRVGATIELLQMMVELVRGGSYLGYFPEISVKNHLESGDLRALRGLSGLPKFQLQALTRRGVTPRKSAQHLIEEIRTQRGPHVALAAQ